jgi:hypothetical protein
VKAQERGKHNKVKALQYLLTRSQSARVLAVERVTENDGRNTPGVDGETWPTLEKKTAGIATLRPRGYRPKPLRRIYIPKKNGKKRPLGIPTMKDRAMQALFLLALDPVVETTADRNSYGFRRERACADAIAQCFNALAKKVSPQWVLEGGYPLGDKSLLRPDQPQLAALPCPYRQRDPPEVAEIRLHGKPCLPHYRGGLAARRNYLPGTGKPDTGWDGKTA